MLDLQRASAGSGKTYTLAKKYIWYYIAIRPEGEERYRLRTIHELRDSARHILAVTFTNKATNEMQMRIVNKLFALAWYDPAGKLPDYLEEFSEALGVSHADISRVCRSALSILLNGYSDFNVSTIDSFFQQVLRTFAYETDINDSYQVELDSAFLSRMGIDATLDEVDSDSGDPDISFWIRHLIGRTGNSSWNIFQRRESEQFTKSENPYSDFVAAITKMENESYKLIRDEVEEYFGMFPGSKPDIGPGGFPGLFIALKEKYEDPLKEAYDSLMAAAREFAQSLPADYRKSGKNAVKGIVKTLEEFRAIRSNTKSRKFIKPTSLPEDFPFKIYPELFEHKDVVAWLSEHPGVSEQARPKGEALAQAYARWAETRMSPGTIHWLFYSNNLPFLGLMSAASRKRQEYLDEINAVELGETSMILRSVIRENDAPFVYERLGTYLNHFLIDEFQDTSELQWHNLSPLLHESMARGNDNLIIGDAKQSIYRFRDAKPQLITYQVPQEFKGSVNMLGDAVKENTNWRSRLRVVQFNNSLFEYLAPQIDAVSADNRRGRIDFTSLYGNVVQHPHHKDDAGYVEVRFLRMKEETYSGYLAEQIPAMIHSMLGRGRRLSDIAILVRTKEQSAEIVRILLDHNSQEPDPSRHIRFVSEQSLKVASSRAVNIVVNVLENIARGASPELNTDEEKRRREGVGQWNDMAIAFRLYAMCHGSDGDTSRLLNDFISQGGDMEDISKMISGMQSMAIPALVEAAIVNLVPEKERKLDAIYLAAFQDLVLEYCDGHPTDIGSFLKWWERKKKEASVASPAKTDAVQLLTIHKSKGLEYPCVIVPYVSQDFADKMGPGRVEWKWVKPQGISAEGYNLPPYIPVDIKPEMALTAHAPVLNEYYDQVKMDNLNSAYVAFTRAAEELYILTRGPVPTSKNPDMPDDDTMFSHLYKFLSKGERAATHEEMPARLSRSAVNFDGEEFVARIGVQPVNVKKTESEEKDEEPETEEEKKKKMNSAETLRDYRAVNPGSYLKYRAQEFKKIITPDEYDEDRDPRSEGNLKHALLSLVETPEDIDRARRHLVATGLVSEREGMEMAEALRAAITSKGAKRWFDGSARVINERSILRNEEKLRCPDRLLLYPDGHAEVIDYKFGSLEERGKHRRQVRRYMRMLADTGMFTRVEGYLWYVNKEHIEKVFADKREKS